MLKIDVHTHIIPRDMPRWTEKFGYGNFIHLEDSNREGFARMMQGNNFFREIASNCWDEEERISEYNNSGVDVQVVCTIPVMFSYDAKPNDALELGRFLNDHMADLVYRFPKKYVGLCTVPLQDVDLAIMELERAKSIGLVGVQIGTNVNGLNLNEPQFFPFFEACSRLGMAVFIHPWDIMGKEEMEKYWLPWLVGMPAETSRAICSMIFGGVFERLPNLRVAFAHGGGSFPATAGRIQQGYDARPDLCAVDNQVDPQKYLGKFWVDSLVHDADALDFLIKKIGADKIALGTDYPFPLGELKPGNLIESMDYNNEQKDKLLFQNALDWLGLPDNHFS